MSENRLHRLADELTIELDRFRNLKAEIVDAQSRIGGREPDVFELRAIGSILHDLYNGAETICLRVAKEIDRRVPVGAAWHRDLLVQMAEPFPKVRPSLLSSETQASLETYRRFRHLVRHTYGSNLDWGELKPLFESAAHTIEMFAQDVEQFANFLRVVASDQDSES